MGEECEHDPKACARARSLDGRVLGFRVFPQLADSGVITVQNDPEHAEKYEIMGVQPRHCYALCRGARGAVVYDNVIGDNERLQEDVENWERLRKLRRYVLPDRSQLAGHGPYELVGFFMNP